MEMKNEYYNCFKTFSVKTEKELIKYALLRKQLKLYVVSCIDEVLHFKRLEEIMKFIRVILLIEIVSFVFTIIEYHPYFL